MARTIDWDDEIIVGWLQKYPNIKQALVEILVRRYKNLLYKEIAKQCDKRYDREDIVQHIVFLFIQLLEEYDATRGIPLAGFLKNKLPNRIYNYFKTQVRLWTAEIQRDNLLSLDDSSGHGHGETDSHDDVYELSQTQTEVHDFWAGVARLLDRRGFEVLFWKFQCDYSLDEISILMGMRGPCEAEKFLNHTIDKLRFDARLFGTATLNAITQAQQTKQANAKVQRTKETLDVTYHLFQVLHHEITAYCGVFDYGDDTMQKHRSMLHAYNAGQDLLLFGLHAILDDIMTKCGLDADNSKKEGLRRYL